MAYPTNPIYKLVKDPFTNEVDSVKTKVGSTVTNIPFKEGNRHYQDYLAWVAEGNTAEAAD